MWPLGAESTLIVGGLAAGAFRGFFYGGGSALPRPGDRSNVRIGVESGRYRLLALCYLSPAKSDKGMCR